MKNKNNSTIEVKRKIRQEKLAKKRNKNLSAFFIMVLSIIAVVIISFSVYQSDLFTVTNVKINGNKYISEGQILKAAAVPKHSNFFNFPVKPVRKRIKTLPWVEDVSLYKSFPGSVVINIKERKPFAYVTNKQMLFIVDGKGFIISAEAFRRLNIPVIEDIKFNKITIGKKINNDNFKNIIKAYGSLSSKTKPKIKIISSPNKEELVFMLKNIEIMYGYAEQNQLKSSVIDKLLDSKDKDNLSLIDVRVPTQPVTRVIGK